MSPNADWNKLRSGEKSLALRVRSIMQFFALLGIACTL